MRGSSPPMPHDHAGPPAVLLPYITNLLPGERQHRVVGLRSPAAPDVEEFRGIPYATVRARWELPQLREDSALEVVEATKHGAVCPQPSAPNNSRSFQARLAFPSGRVESEFQCLNLSIFRPRLPPTSNINGNDDAADAQMPIMPVLVWIHGGGYGFGSFSDPMWDAARLTQRSFDLGTPMIIVGVNYRLNIFGFMAPPETTMMDGGHTTTHNLGLCDQKTALIWIRRNIAAFGGDPGKVTIAGQSAGAVSVHALLLDTLNQGQPMLLRRAVCQSGALGTLGPVLLSRSRNYWLDLCRYFGLEGIPPSEQVRQLQEMEAEKLVTAGINLHWLFFPLVEDGSTIRKTDEGYEVKIPVPIPLDTQEERPVQRFGVLLGDTDSEGSIYRSKVDHICDIEDIRALLEKHAASAAAVRELLDIYKIVPALPTAALREHVLTFISDVMFKLPVYELRRSLCRLKTARSKTGSVALRTYRIDFGNPFPGLSYGIAHHCVELIYLFDCFHDYLAAVDQENLSDTASPSLYTTSTASPYPTPLLRRSDFDLDVTKPATISLIELPTHAALAEDISNRWIRFVTSEDDEDEERSWARQDLIDVFGENRQVRTENLRTGSRWLEEQKRFEVLKRYPEMVKAVFRDITLELLL